ncbi:cation diffusion facilitator family transporter [candidate division KSB1 bacterium]
MKKFTRWIAVKLIKNHQNINDLKVRAQYGALEGWVSIVINILLFVIKLLIGLSIKSVSLIADAIHTLADSVTSVVVIIGFKMAKKPSDKKHPFGHGRMESITTLIVSVLLFIASVELMQKSIHSIIQPQAASTASIDVILLIVGTIVIKELMSRFSYELGEIIDSKTLKADALHHRSDVIATGLVVVALIASRFGYSHIDGVMGAFISFIIFYSAYSIAKEAINPLLGEAPSKETIKEIERMSRAHEGVLGVHDIIFHKYGQTNIISLHIEVSDKEAISKLHMLSETIENEITQKMGGTVIVHIDPINREHPKYEDIAQTIKEIISEDNRVNSFHELRIVGCDANKCNVVFDIALEQDVDEQEIYDIIRSIQEKFKDRFPEMRTIIKAEPKYAYNI